ncbi:hypothetical protein [Novilysobacter arseniciresistens]|nr:hypothetical protein [Lysobacter arseniciresistens]
MGAVLVPLFLLVPILAKYIHLQHKGEQMARASAWQATVHKDYGVPERARMERLLMARHFAPANEPVRSTVPAAPSPRSPVPGVFLNTFSNQPLLRRADVQLGRYANRGAPGFMDDVLDMAESFPGEFPPNDKGLVETRVNINPQNLRTIDGRPAVYLAPFDTINLRMESHQMLLADAWNAAGAGKGESPHPRSVLAQVRTLVPSSYLDGVLPDWKIPDVIPVVGVLDNLDIGHIEPDVVPKPRLEPYAPRR